MGVKPTVRTSLTWKGPMVMMACVFVMGCPKPLPDPFAEDVSESNADVTSIVADDEPIACEDDASCPPRPNSSPVCVANECGFACIAGFSDCDREVPNGCEQSLTTPFACGGCYSACQPNHAFGSCVSGTCEIAACDLGYGDCDGQVDNGCEAPVVTVSNCGECGVRLQTEHEYRDHIREHEGEKSEQYLKDQMAPPKFSGESPQDYR